MSNEGDLVPLILATGNAYNVPLIHQHVWSLALILINVVGDCSTHPFYSLLMLIQLRIYTVVCLLL